MSVLIASLAPVLTFALYALFGATVFHFRAVSRPLVFMTVSFVPFLAIQSLVLWRSLRYPPPAEPFADAAAYALAYGLPCLVAVLLGWAYLQFYCLMEFSISLRMLDHFLAAPRRELSFRDLRQAYPLEEVIERKCAAAGNVGLLRARREEDGIVLDLPATGLPVIRFIGRLKAFLNWTDAG
jgi:hypothetical protein